jgi:CHAD domain-containing protein
VAVARRDQPIGHFIADALAQKLQSLLKGSSHLRSLAPIPRHRVRIKAKKLRYMLEPFEGLTKEKDFKAIVKELKVLQDTLGKLHDSQTSAESMTRICTESVGRRGSDRMLLFAAGLVAGAQKEDPQLLIQAQKARDRLARIRPFWAS